VTANLSGSYRIANDANVSSVVMTTYAAAVRCAQVCFARSRDLAPITLTRSLEARLRIIVLIIRPTKWYVCNEVDSINSLWAFLFYHRKCKNDAKSTSVA